MQVVWLEKFKAEDIDKYDGSNNPEELTQVYHTVIEAAGRYDQVKANYLPTALSGAARSWLSNLPEKSIYNWAQLCTIFTGSFQGTYERPTTTETLKTMQQKHDESLWDYVKSFCNARNTILYIQDIKIINAFHDGVNDIKTIEEISMMKPKTVVDLLVVVESHGKGPSKKKQDDREVNTTDCEDRRDCGYRGNHQ
jgi:hypothetical protein